MPGYTLTIEEIARELRPRRREGGPLSPHERRVARRTIDTLIANHGFPRPIPGAPGPLWSRARVRAWIDGGGQPAADEAAAPLDPVARDRAELEARFLTPAGLAPHNPRWA